jgi:uncharacterized phage protein gp47/JayE
MTGILPTLAATVDQNGISAPSYAAILASLQAQMQQIFGEDIDIDDDTQDGQMITIFAQAMNDANTMAIATYNNFSPATSQGAGLSSMVKINGLQRLIPTNSTVDVEIVGVAGTTITNGIVQDPAGNNWNLPASVVVPTGGSIVVTATCQAEGAIALGTGQSLTIYTPTRGWQTATTTAAATPGNPVETDAALRQRQSVSTELPAESIIGSIIGAIANLTGVEQYKIYENDTGATNSLGLPGHSIAVVVLGGDSGQIAQTIEQKKTPGTATYGTTTEIVEDPIGLPVTINFFRPSDVTIDVTVNITPLNGYVNSTGVAIQNAIANAISALGIYANNGLLALSTLYAAAYSVANNTTFNVTSILQARSPASPIAADVSIAFNELPVCVASDVTLNVA